MNWCCFIIICHIDFQFLIRIQMLKHNYIQFISINSFGQIVLHAKAVDLIRSLTPPISLVTTIGPSSTGKTFLINQIITNSPPSFQEPTKGLWVWNKPLLATNSDGQICTMLFIDSEGFTLQENQNQKKLLSMTLLLSSCILYNSIGPIDSISIKQLEIIANLAKQIKPRDCHFHWILRDFDPIIVNQLGIDISPKEYMENRIMQVKEQSDHQTIVSMKQFFSSRHCHCFSKPLPNQTEQPPQFLQQIIELRKILKCLPSLDLEGNSIIIIIESYIESLNNGDSLEKTCQEGNDCRTRLQCLERLGDELRSLEQKQSLNEIQDVEERLYDIRTHLKEYYKQRMSSHRQIQTLDGQLNEIIQDFQDLNENSHNRSVNMRPSREAIKLTAPKPDKMMRVSLNISEAGRERVQHQLRPYTSINKIETSKNIQNKLEDFQTKIYRYELEANSSKKEIVCLLSEYQRSKKALESKEEQLQELVMAWNQKERSYKCKVEQLSEQLQEANKQKLMAQSEISKMQILNSERLHYLEQIIENITSTKHSELEAKEEKYKLKLAEYTKEIEELKYSHQQQMQQLKNIFKTNQEHLRESDQVKKTENFYRDMRQQMNLTEKMKEQLERDRYLKAELESGIKALKRQLESKQELHKESIDLLLKRNKQSQRRLEEVFNTRLQSKELIISELQVKIGEVIRYREESESVNDHLINTKASYINELEGDVAAKTQIINRMEKDIRKKEDQLSDIRQNLQSERQNLIQQKRIVTEHAKKIQRLSQDICDFRESQKLMQQNSQKQALAHAQITDELQDRVNQLESQLYYKSNQSTQQKQIKELFEIEKSRLLLKVDQLQMTVDNLRRFERAYQEIQQQSALAQAQFKEILDERQKSLSDSCGALQEACQELEKSKKRNAELVAAIIKNREEDKHNLAQMESESKTSQQLTQETLQNLKLSNNEKERQIFILTQQLEKEQRANIITKQQLQVSINQAQIKNQKAIQLANEENQKLKTQLKTLRQKQQQLQTELAMMAHKIHLGDQESALRLEKKNLEIAKLKEKTASSEIKIEEASKQAFKLKQTIALLEAKVAKLNKLQAIYTRQKAVMLQNIQEIEQKQRINERRYESHLNLFQAKQAQLKSENQQLQQKLQQYIRDYRSLEETKTKIEHSLQQNCILWQNKLNIQVQSKK